MVTKHSKVWRADEVTKHGKVWRESVVTKHGKVWKEDVVNRCPESPVPRAFSLSAKLPS